MMIKANRTPHHQPEGSPGYADHPSLTPLRRGFFFSASQRAQRRHLDPGDAAAQYLCCNRPKEWCRVSALVRPPELPASFHPAPWASKGRLRGILGEGSRSRCFFMNQFPAAFPTASALEYAALARTPGQPTPPRPDVFLCLLPPSSLPVEGSKATVISKELAPIRRNRMCATQASLFAGLRPAGSGAIDR